MKQVRNVNNNAARGKKSRRGGLIWSLAVLLVIIVLLATEQVALLYVLATLSISALLTIVALSSFGEARVATEPVPFDDAAAIADRNAPVRTDAATSKRAVSR